MGVADLDRSLAFYRDVIGWTPAPSPPEIVFFDLGGIVFSLYAHADLARDIDAPVADPEGAVYQGFALAHNTRSEADVDAIFARLREKGATIVKAPERAFWGGYSGTFADPDGHVWEVAHNPHWSIGADGRISISTD